MPTTVHATVKLVIEMKESAWGSDCTLAQVYKQAREGALEKLTAASRHNKLGINIINATVTAVIVPEKE